MKKITKLLILAGILFAFNNKLSAQSDQYIGINSGVGLASNSTQTYAGLSYENRFSNVFGFESGILKRKFYTEDYGFSYITMPLSLKIYTNIININLGAEGGLFTGADIYTSSNYTVAWNSQFYYSIFGKISHDFSLSKSFYLEPEIFINHNSVESVSFGAGIKLKYLL